MRDRSVTSPNETPRQTNNLPGVFDVSQNQYSQAGRQRRKRRRPHSRGARRIVLGIVGVVIVLLIWQAMSMLLPPWMLPSPILILQDSVTILFSSKILMVQGGGSRGISKHLLYTIIMTLVGSTIGTALGAAFGTLLGWNRKLRRVFEPLVEAARTIPPLAIIPFFIMWFGPSREAQVAVLVFYCFATILVNTLEALENVNPVFAQFAATFGANRGQIFRNVMLPAIVPELVGGIRVVIGFSWGIQVVGELMGSPLGMGQVFSMALSFQALSIILPGILWITILAYLFDRLFTVIARRFTSWAPTIGQE